MSICKEVFQTKEHEFDLCVVGGGMTGVCAAIAAARHGAKVALVQDRAVLGGNSSSEIRMHICGADRHNRIPNMRETGILEELRLKNLHENPNQEVPMWDYVLYESVRAEENITMFMNSTCQSAQMEGENVKYIIAWQLTTETYHKIRASIFMDCTGDGTLAPLTGADFRIGREASSEYGESIAPEVADKRTMGLTCLFSARPYDTPQKFTPPPWARVFESDDDLPYGADGHKNFSRGYWWIELGGEDDSIADTEKLRDELLSIVMGVWDHIKNRGDHGADNWALEWVGFLPGKRESRRYLGAHVMTQGDIESGGKFEDIVTYGGWSMDDHHPAGFGSKKLGKPSTIFHPAPSPYGIPYRCLYSRNVKNLMCAGRCVSSTHAALSSMRVMGTCAAMGQAAGTAAALAVKDGLTLDGVCEKIAELQNLLHKDDCYLPGVVKPASELCLSASIAASNGADAEVVRDGIARPVGEDIHAWTGSAGDSITCSFEGEKYVESASLVVDSALDCNIALELYHCDTPKKTPDVMLKSFRLEGLSGGEWVGLENVTDNFQRYHTFEIKRELSAIRLVLEETHGADSTRIYEFMID